MGGRGPWPSLPNIQNSLLALSDNATEQPCCLLIRYDTKFRFSLTVACHKMQDDTVVKQVKRISHVHLLVILTDQHIVEPQ